MAHLRRLVPLVNHPVVVSPSKVLTIIIMPVLVIIVTLVQHEPVPYDRGGDPSVSWGQVNSDGSIRALAASGCIW